MLKTRFMEFLTEFGYTGIFISSFLAATILPLSSEIVLSALLLNGLSPVPLVLIATIGNVLGAFVNYLAGFYGSGYVIKKWLSTSEASIISAQNRFNKYGVLSLLLAWVPVIGDPLTVIAGILRVNLLIFFSLVSIGKFIRYLLICHIILSS